MRCENRQKLRRINCALRLDSTQSIQCANDLLLRKKDLQSWKGEIMLKNII